MGSNQEQYTEGGRGITKVLFFILLLVPAITASFSDESCLRKIEQRYSSGSGLILSYEREIISKSMNLLGTGMKEDIATGRIFLKSPYFLRIEQEKPVHEVIVNNGKDVWWYIPSKKIAYKYKAKKFSRELNILKDIFTGMRGIKKEFHISLKKNSKVMFILLRPIRPWQDIEKIEIQTNKNDFRIRSLKIYNLFGSITHFRLTNEIKTNLKKDVFSINLPKGVKIIKK